jgi:hypothetical protein
LSPSRQLSPEAKSAAALATMRAPSNFGGLAIASAPGMQSDRSPGMGRTRIGGSLGRGDSESDPEREGGRHSRGSV